MVSGIKVKQWIREVIVPGSGLEEKSLAFCLWVIVGTIPVSIFLCQLFLFLAVLLAIGIYFRPGKGDRANGIPFFLPLLLCLLTTFLSAMASDDPGNSLKALKKFLLIIPVLFLFSRHLHSPRQIQGLLGTLFLSSAASTLLAAAQYPTADLLHRASGFMGHWQTFAGQLMMIVAVLAGLLLFFSENRTVHLLLFLTLMAGLLFSETRGSWLGAVLALFFLIWIKDRRLPLFFLAVIFLTYFLLPERIQLRVQSIYSAVTDGKIDEPRFNMWETGLHMISAHPWLGVGPNRVQYLAPQYGGNPNYHPRFFMHLHNNYLQLAAERGIPGFIAWMWLLYEVLRLLCRNLSGNIFPKDSFPFALNRGVLGALIALMTAGVFEFNLGDSEVLILFLFLASCVVALRRIYLQPPQKAGMNVSGDPVSPA